MRYYYKKDKPHNYHNLPPLEYFTLILNGRRTKILFLARYVSEALRMVRKYYPQETRIDLEPSTNHDVIYATATIKGD